MASFDEHPFSGRPGSGPSDGRGVSLLAALRRRLWIVILTAILVTAGAAAFAYAGRNNYQTTAELLFSQVVGPDLSGLGLPPVAVNADKQALDNVAFVGSRRVAQAAARALGPGVTVDSVQQDVVVSGGKTNDVVNVTATSHPAPRAAQLANAYAGAAVRLAQSDQFQRDRTVARALADQLNRMATRDRENAFGVLLRTRLAQVQTLEAAGTGSPQVIQSGYTPSGPSGSIAQTVVLGGLLGLLLGAGLALLREQADRRLRHAGEVSAAFEAPVLATIPRNRALGKNLPLDRLPDEVAQAFLMLQSNLRYGSSKPVRSVLITSSRGQQGKTTIAWNLALTAVASGLSVVLVDADLRRSSLAARYELKPFPGLRELLRGDLSFSQAIQSVRVAPDAKSTNSHGDQVLSVLVAGSAPPDPSALLQSTLMTDLLGSLKQNYDLVIVDTPPIAQVADAIALLRSVDGVLVVASINSTRGPEAERLRDQLQALDARVEGVVANGGTRAAGYAYVGRQTKTS